jgi:hypothetical protein
MLVQFSSKQKLAIDGGLAKRTRLIRASKQAASGLGYGTTYAKPVHYYIYGPSGIGKTYWANKAVKESGVIHVTVSGNVSMFAFGIDLAITKFMFQDQPVVIIIDDCDEILKDAKSINQMKELLDKNKFTYNKRIHLASLGDEDSTPYMAVEQCMNGKGIGFEVDCSNFTFIITSNIKLPFDSTAHDIVEKNGGMDNARSIRARHLAAIRGRCEVKDLDMAWEEKWGNLAYVTLEDDACKDCDLEQKHFILEYIWNNWDEMKETSIRTVEKMARFFQLEGPDGIKDAFDADFLK